MLKKQKYDNMRDYAGLDLTVREGQKKYAGVIAKDPVLRWGREPSVLHSLGFKRLSESNPTLSAISLLCDPGQVI